MIDLDAYNSVRTALFVRLQIDEYRTSPWGSYTQEVLTFSDHSADFTIEGEVYQTVGRLMGVTSTTNELRASSSTVSLSLTGIPDSAIAEIINSKIKGAPVRIQRGYFNAQTGAQIGDIQGRFLGFVNNYSLQEDYDIAGRTATNTILLECASNIDILARKTSGRKTNPESEKRYFPNDKGMDRVPNLEGTTFNFGGPS